MRRQAREVEFVCQDCREKVVKKRKRPCSDGKLRCRNCYLSKYPTLDEGRKEAQKRYFKTAKGRAATQRYRKKRRSNDPNFKLAWNLRCRLNTALRSNCKSGSAVKDLGCSIEFFKNYLEERFREGMSWDNYGQVWEIDHIVPLSSFNLLDRDQFLRACHHTNMQPLHISENRNKSNKVL